VGGTRISSSGFASFNRSVAREHALLEERLDHLLHEEGVALGALDDEALERQGAFIIARQRSQQLLGALSA
jgi:hypothetical protein